MKLLILSSLLVLSVALPALYTGKNITVNEDGSVKIVTPNGKHVDIEKSTDVAGHKTVEITVSGPYTPTKKIHINDEVRVSDEFSDPRIKRSKSADQGEILISILKQFQGPVDEPTFQKLLRKIEKSVEKGELDRIIYDILSRIDSTETDAMYQQFAAQQQYGQQQIRNPMDALIQNEVQRQQLMNEVQKQQLVNQLEQEIAEEQLEKQIREQQVWNRLSGSPNQAQNPLVANLVNQLGGPSQGTQHPLLKVLQQQQEQQQLARLTGVPQMAQTPFWKQQQQQVENEILSQYVNRMAGVPTTQNAFMKEQQQQVEEQILRQVENQIQRQQQQAQNQIISQYVNRLSGASQNQSPFLRQQQQQVEEQILKQQVQNQILHQQQQEQAEKQILSQYVNRLSGASQTQSPFFRQQQQQQVENEILKQQVQNQILQQQQQAAQQIAAQLVNTLSGVPQSQNPFQRQQQQQVQEQILKQQVQEEILKQQVQNQILQQQQQEQAEKQIVAQLVNSLSGGPQSQNPFQTQQQQVEDQIRQQVEEQILKQQVQNQIFNKLSGAAQMTQSPFWRQQQQILASQVAQKIRNPFWQYQQNQGPYGTTSRNAVTDQIVSQVLKNQIAGAQDPVHTQILAQLLRRKYQGQYETEQESPFYGQQTLGPMQQQWLQNQQGQTSQLWRLLGLASHGVTGPSVGNVNVPLVDVSRYGPISRNTMPTHYQQL